MSQATKEFIFQEKHSSYPSEEFSQTAASENLSECSESLKLPIHAWQESLISLTRIASFAFALSLSVAVPSSASTLSYLGDTTNAPTFNRPATAGYESGSNPPTSLSSNGTAVPYYSQPFTVDTTGFYGVLGVQAFDGIQFLYQTNFNPANPLTNLLSGNDPFPDEGTSGFSRLSLSASNQYFLVTTGFDNTNSSFGTFTNTIAGPGNITLGTLTPSKSVPEPSSIPSTIAFGLFGGGLILKRQLNKQKSVKLETANT